jgi:hypothetical protein
MGRMPNQSEEPTEISKALPQLEHKILNSRTGGSLRMYKCECGEQMWIDLPV